MASSGDAPSPLAPVQRWNAHIVYLQCPFCSKIHSRDFGDSYASINRDARCTLSSHLLFPSYRFSYPFSVLEETTAYEVDKSIGYFVALGAKTPETKTDSIEKELDNLNLNADELSDSRSWKDATEMITIGIEDKRFRRLQEYLGGEDTYTLKRLDHIVSQMLTSGDCNYVADYMRTSLEADLFLFGINEEGSSALNLAACEKYPAMVKLLLDHGADVDSRNKIGRSPLMEAALWGRIGNVKYFLDHGANRNLRDVHDNRAIELAEPSLRNDEERYWRSGGAVQIYCEVTFIANQARRVICELLNEPKDHHTEVVPKQDQMIQTHSFKMTNRQSIELVAPIAEFFIPTESKTIASLQRPLKYPFIAAMSGWSHSGTKVTISGKEWTAEVKRIARIVGHELPVDRQRDQGVEGLFFASHAEKQLVAYFISKHVLIECEEQELLQRQSHPSYLRRPQFL